MDNEENVFPTPKKKSKLSGKLSRRKRPQHQQEKPMEVDAVDLPSPRIGGYLAAV